MTKTNAFEDTWVLLETSPPPFSRSNGILNGGQVMTMLLEYLLRLGGPEAVSKFSKSKLRLVMLSGDFCPLSAPRSVSQ